MQATRCLIQALWGHLGGSDPCPPGQQVMCAAQGDAEQAYDIPEFPFRVVVIADQFLFRAWCFRALAAPRPAIAREQRPVLEACILPGRSLVT